MSTFLFQDVLLSGGFSPSGAQSSPQKPVDVLVNVASALLCMLSLGAATWLLYAVLRLPIATRSKLMARQLQCLAAADIFTFCTKAVPLVAGVLVFLFRMPTRASLEIVCNVGFAGFSGFIIRDFIVMHIALTMVASIAQWDSLLLLLRRSLVPLCWVSVAVALGVYFATCVGFVHVNWNAEYETCSRTPRSQIIIVVAFGVGVVSVGLFLAIYVYCALTLRRASVGMRERLIRRGLLFSLANIVTTVPWFTSMVIFKPGSHMVNDRALIPLMMTGGLFDALVYVFLCRHTRYWLQQDAAAQAPSEPASASQRSSADTSESSTSQPSMTHGVHFATRESLHAVSWHGEGWDWMVDPLLDEPSQPGLVRSSMNPGAEIIAKKASGAVVRGTRHRNWLQLDNEPGFMLLRESRLVQRQDWELSPLGDAAVEIIYAEAKTDSNLLGAKRSGTVVSGYVKSKRREWWLKIADELGYIQIQFDRDISNVKEVTWERWQGAALLQNRSHNSPASSSAEDILFSHFESSVVDSVSASSRSNLASVPETFATDYTLEANTLQNMEATREDGIPTHCMERCCYFFSRHTTAMQAAGL